MTSSTWAPGYNDAGVYKVDVTCADSSGKESTEEAVVTVEDRNRPPSITAMVTRG